MRLHEYYFENLGGKGGLDVFGHAFMIDYALKRADYIEAFFKNIERQTVKMGQFTFYN